MKNKNTMLILKIVVPVLMLTLIGGIWLAQNIGSAGTMPATVPAKTDTATQSGVDDKKGTGAQATTGETPGATQASGEFPLNVTSVDIDTLSEHGLPMIIDFGADECAPCRAMAPVLVNVNAAMQGRAIVQFVDVWKHPDAASGFPIQVIPTQIFVNADGTPYWPAEDIGVSLTPVFDPNTDEHLFTLHQGALTEPQMNTILEDMGVE